MADLANADPAKFISNIHFLYIFTSFENKLKKYGKIAELVKIKTVTVAVLDL